MVFPSETLYEGGGRTGSLETGWLGLNRSSATCCLCDKVTFFYPLFSIYEMDVIVVLHSKDYEE